LHFSRLAPAQPPFNIQISAAIFARPAIREGFPFSFGSFANVIGADFSNRLTNWSGVERDFDQVKGAILSQRNFRYALARRAFFVSAYLRGANFFGADRSFADLRQAQLLGPTSRRPTSIMPSFKART
jgi:uncharacterized protein YjbI with pentapeptide repeats